MAFRGRRRSRDRRSKRWTGDQNAAGGTALGAGVLGFLQIVASSDYEQSATLESGGVTLARVRGSGTIATAGVTSNDFIMAVYVLDDGATPIATGFADPSVFAELIRGDLLWLKRIHVPLSTEREFEFDIRAKRKMVDKQVVYTVRNIAGAGTGTVYVSARALLLGG